VIFLSMALAFKVSNSLLKSQILLTSLLKKYVHKLSVYVE